MTIILLVHTRGGRRVTAKSDDPTEFPDSGKISVSQSTSGSFSYTEDIWHPLMRTSAW